MTLFVRVVICLLAASIIGWVRAEEPSSCCNSLESWQVLDLHGDGQALEVEDLTTPPGYGPKVVHLEGKELFLFSKASPITAGTILTLWRDVDPHEKDADGVLLFEADYPSDLQTAGNLKEKRSHTWIEQDSDEGFQVKRYTLESRQEAALADQPGVGLTQEPWNITGWIWQKVSLGSDGLKAKFWSFGTPEPEWQIEIPGWRLKPGRVGVAVHSGSARIAFFAVSPKDLNPPLPQAVLHVSHPVCYTPEKLEVHLLLNLPGDLHEARIRLELLDPTQVLAHKEISRNLPAGFTGIRFGPDGETIPLPATPIVGKRTLQAALARSSGEVVLAVTKEIEFLSTEGYRKKVKELRNNIEFGLASLMPWDPADEGKLAALRHLELAEQRLTDGEIDKAKGSIEYAEEALQQILPPFQNPRPASVSFSAEPSAQSLVMGETYEVSVHWQCLNSLRVGSTENPGEACTVRLTMTDDLRVENPIVSEISQPVESWKEGKAKTTLCFRVPEEFPKSSKEPIAAPKIREGWHRIWLSLLRADGSHEWISGGEPDVGDFGTRHQIARVYVTQNPIEIGNSEVLLDSQRHPQSVSIPLRNRRSVPASFQVCTRIRTECGRTVWSDVRSLEMPPLGEETLSCGLGGFRWQGHLVLETEIFQGQMPITRAEMPFYVSGQPGDARRSPQMVLKDGAWLSQVEVAATCQANLPKKIRVQIESREGKTISSDLVFDSPGWSSQAVEVEPSLGTYHVTLTVKDEDEKEWSTDKSLPATVFENRAGKLYLNGEPFIVKGVNVHSMIADSPERNRHLMRLLKDIGFNMLRGDYPPPWEVDMADEENLGWMVLAPFSVNDTNYYKNLYAPHPFPRMREITRRFIETYRDKPAVWLWNSCNEITGELDDFLVTLYPLYKALDPAQRLVVYANLPGQDRALGQDLMAVNYYYGPPQEAKDRQPMIDRSLAEARKAGIPCIFTEFNCWYGPVYSRGAESVRDLFEYGVEQGMAGGFLFMLPEHPDRHPGVVATRENLWTNPTFTAALRHAFDDAVVELAARGNSGPRFRVRNTRDFSLRKVQYELLEDGHMKASGTLPDIDPRGSAEIALVEAKPKSAHTYQAELRFETHHGLRCRVSNRVSVLPGS